MHHAIEPASINLNLSVRAEVSKPLRALRYLRANGFKLMSTGSIIVMHDFSTLHLTTARLHLRPLQPVDAEPLFAIFSNAEVMRFWSTGPWPSVAHSRELIEKDCKELAAGEHIRLGLFMNVGDELIGTCSLFNFDAQCRRAEIGYALQPSIWGQGLVQEAVSVVLAYGFATLNLNRVEADIDPRNTVSARSLERLGFQQEGLLRERWIVGNEVSDSALYGLLASQWRAAQATHTSGK
jgi:[ribosomal protein S5]-alanine N-acetyltransferase